MFDLAKVSVVYFKDSQEHRDMDTGYRLTNTEVSKRINNYVKSELKDGLEEIGELDGMVDFRVVKARNGQSYHVINIKTGYDFIKTFKVDLRDMMEEVDLTPHACKFMYKMTAWLHFPENTIVYKKKNPSIEDLCEALNLKRARIYKVLKELEDYELIKRDKVNGQLIIYVNPFIHSCGWVSSETIDMFKDSKHNREELML